MARTLKRSISVSIFLLLSLTFLINAQRAQAADCRQTCVSVHREGGELIITAKRDPKPMVRNTPSVTPTRRASAPVRRSPVKPRPKFSDQIRELLPEGRFTFLPRSGAVVNEPLLIRTYGCTDFVKRLPILDTTIELQLSPRIEWVWGDGQREVWGRSAIRGAHIYSRSGNYLMEMRCRWGGSFRTPHSEWAPIPEGILSTAMERVEISRAFVFFTE